MDENPQTVPPPHYPDGSRVLCADGQTLGEVVATYREHLIVERGYFFPTTFYVPYAAIAEAGGGDIVLSLTSRDALSQGWHTPPADPVAPAAPLVAPPVAAARTMVEPVAATVAPDGPTEAVPIEEADAVDRRAVAPEASPTAPTTPSPAIVAVEVPGVAEEATTTAPPAVPVEETVPVGEAVAVGEAVEVQSFQPDATVPPPAESEEAGTVALAPSFVGIPGRRLTDAELWSLLEPRDAPTESGDQPNEAPDQHDPPDKPGGR